MKYATRINSFLRFDSNLLNAFQSIGSIEGVDYVDDKGKDGGMRTEM